MADLDIEGGLYGMNIGNQQFTMRNVKISKAVTGISQIWNWGWLYSGLTISDCGTAFSMTNGAQSNKLEVGSVVIIDSEITNCPTFVDQAWTLRTTPIGAGQLVIENVKLNNVPVAVKGPGGATTLAGGSITIKAWGQGNRYTPNGPQKFQGVLTTATRPAGLLADGKYYSKSKPQYETLGAASFVSARTAGATGDGRTDDTVAVRNAIRTAVSQGKVLFFEHGVYRVTDTIDFPAGLRAVGESFSAIMGSGNNFADQNNPRPVVRIGKAGESGSIEWSDMLVQTQEGTAGAKLIEYNLRTARGSGIWDVHTRVGGAKGTGHQVAQCPTGSRNAQCFAAHTNVHVTSSASGAYFEVSNDPRIDARTSLRKPYRTTGFGQLITTWMTGTRLAFQSLLDVAYLLKVGVLGSGQTVLSTTLCTSTSSTRRRTSLPVSFRPRRHTTCPTLMHSVSRMFDKQLTATLYTLLDRAHGASALWTPLMS
jgi:glucan 1,3-beta-glucosidase